MEYFLEQFDEALGEAIHCSKKDFVIRYNLISGNMLRDYFKQCYNEKKIDAEKLKDLCKNTFGVICNDSNTGKLYQYYVESCIYRFSNKFFNEKCVY